MSRRTVPAAVGLAATSLSSPASAGMVGQHRDPNAAARVVGVVSNRSFKALGNLQRTGARHKGRMGGIAVAMTDNSDGHAASNWDGS